MVRRLQFTCEILLSAALGWLLWSLVGYAVSAPPSFDGAMNLNTARFFLAGRGYGFVYDAFFAFPAQTDGPFVLPSALWMAVGGITPLSAQGVNLLYLVGAAALVAQAVWRMVGSRPLALLAVLLCLLTPGTLHFGMNGYGEVPMVFWFLAAHALLAPTLRAGAVPSRARLGAGGACLALCYLTKTVALLMVAPTIVIFAVLFIRRHRAHAHLLAWALAGLLAPIAAWELFRSQQLAGLGGYVQWWTLQLEQVFRQSGAHESVVSKPSLAAKGLHHAHVLAELQGRHTGLQLLTLLLPWAGAAWMAHRAWADRADDRLFTLLVLGVVAALFFTWWLFITPTHMAWLRRILIGLWLQHMLAVVVIGSGLSWLRRSPSVLSRPRWMTASACVAGLLGAELLLLNQGRLRYQPLVPSSDAVGQLALARQVASLPADATLFGFGWWQAPVVSLFSGRTMMNYWRWPAERINQLPHKYLVVDGYAKQLAHPSDVGDILAASRHTMLSDGPGGALYELHEVSAYPPFTPQDRRSPDLRSGVRIADGAYALSRGFHGPEGQGAWVKPDAAVLLRRGSERQLRLQVYLPPQIVPVVAGDPVTLSIRSDGCLDTRLAVGDAGLRTFELPLTCPASVTPVAMEIALHLNGHMPFIRQIDGDPRPLAYQILSIGLTPIGVP